MQIVFKLHVHEGIGTGGRDRLFSRVVEMPYLPPVGMEVIEGDWSATVESLAFANGQTFAFVEPDKSPNRYRTAEEMEDLASEYISEGWQSSDRVLGV
jgi:hypothetical protein